MFTYIQNERESVLHWIMTASAGFLGTFGLLMHGGNFGNAMTGNFMSMAAECSTGDFRSVLIRLGAFSLFCSAAIASYLLAHFTALPVKKLAVLVDICGVLCVSLMPEKLHPVISVYPIYFCSCFQWGAFSSARGYNCASVFVSNNVKQSALAWTEYCLSHSPEEKRKAVVYTFTVMSFFFGALAGSLAALKIGAHGALIGLFPLFVASLLLFNQAENESQMVRGA